MAVIAFFILVGVGGLALASYASIGLLILRRELAKQEQKLLLPEED